MSYDTIAKQFNGIAARATSCWCGIQFVVPAELYRYWERTNEAKPGSYSLWCPLGHQSVPGGKTASEREAERLRDELAKQKHRTEQAEEDARHQRVRVRLSERQVAARKGQITKLRNRIGNGVCPCCNRYFANLHRHMRGQHPDWTPESEGEIDSSVAEILTIAGTAADWKKMAERRRGLGIDVNTAAPAIGLTPGSLRAYEGGAMRSLSAALRYVSYLNAELKRAASPTTEDRAHG